MPKTDYVVVPVRIRRELVEIYLQAHLVPNEAIRALGKALGETQTHRPVPVVQEELSFD